jgi:hypothetical protein
MGRRHGFYVPSTHEPGGDGGRLIGEEDAMPHVSGAATCVEQQLFHAASWKTSPSVYRWPDRITDTPWRTGAADQPRTDWTGRSRVVNK